MNIQPLYEKVLVKRHAQSERIGSLYVPAGAQQKQDVGTVLAVGTGAINSDGSVRPLTVKPGDEVLFTQYAGVEFKDGDQSYLILKEEEIWGIRTR